MIEIIIDSVFKNFGFSNVLKGAGFEINTNERAGLVGANGAGKTTLFHMILGEESPDKGTVFVRKNASIGYLEQIHKNTEYALTAGEVLKEAFSEVFDIEKKLREIEGKMAHGAADTDRLLREYTHWQDRFAALDGYSVDEEFGKIVSGFKLDGLLETPFNKLSGGEKTIIKLASLLLRKPDILLLDEPTNHLDMGMLEWFESFLAKYKGTVLIISHDRYFLDKTVNKIIYVESGVCDVYNGNYTYYVAERERRLLAEFNEYKTQQRKIEAMEAAIKRYRQWGNESGNEKHFIKAKELEKRLAKMDVKEDPRPKEFKLPLNFKSSRGSNDALTIANLCFGYGAAPVFDNFSMNLYFGEKVCLLGPNGSGKTTLFKIILGDLRPAAGAVKLGETAFVGYIPQEITFADDRAGVIDAFRQEIACLEGQARNILAKYYFTGESVFKRVGNLSGGEKVILKLAILLQKNVNFLLLDEPTNHIDIMAREILEEALLNYRGTLFCISHDRYFIDKIAERTINI